MKHRRYLLFAGIFLFFACKKDSSQQNQQQSNSLENGLVSLSVSNQLVEADINTTTNTITVTVPDLSSEQNLKLNFNLQEGVKALIGNSTVVSGANVNLSQPLNFTVTSADSKRSTTFQLVAQTMMNYFGLPGTATSGKSLNKNYNFYYDQFTSGQWALVNCGPATSTMAVKWADSTFTGKPADARQLFEPQGGWWSTDDITLELNHGRINNVVDTIANLDSLIKHNIDNNNTVILCLDMNYVPFNPSPVQHIGKFYQTTPNWGHFILVKGYKQFLNSFYLEAYDPYSDGIVYSTITLNQPKGQDRYYNSNDIRLATSKWWSYAIIVAPKGQKILASLNSTHVMLSNRKIPVAFGK